MGEAVNSENQLIDGPIAEVLVHILSILTAIVVAVREFACAIFFRALQYLERDFVVRVDRETWMYHAAYGGAMGQLAHAPGMHTRWLPHREYGQSEYVSINLLVMWKRGYAERYRGVAQPWLLATSRADPKLVFSLYRICRKIETAFRFFKAELALESSRPGLGTTGSNSSRSLRLFMFSCSLYTHQRKLDLSNSCF